jgi:hypothetical protein
MNGYMGIKLQSGNSMISVMTQADSNDISKLVQYYSEGLRVGTLERIKGKTAIIQPMAAKHGKRPHTVKVSLGDVRKIEQPR